MTKQSSNADASSPKYAIGERHYLTIHTIWHLWLPWVVSIDIEAIRKTRLGYRYLVSWDVQSNSMSEYTRAKWVSERRIV